MLDDVGRKCQNDSFAFLKIFAYADNKREKEHNERLAKKRGGAVYDYLTGKFSIDTTKIYLTWIGDDTEEAYDLHFPGAKVRQRAVAVLVYFK